MMSPEQLRAIREKAEADRGTGGCEEWCADLTLELLAELDAARGALKNAEEYIQALLSGDNE